MFQLQLARHHLNTHTNTYACNINIKESGLFMSTKNPFVKSSEKVLRVTLASERHNLPSLFTINHNLTTMHFINEFVPFPQCVLSNLLAKISFSESSTTNVTTQQQQFMLPGQIIQAMACTKYFMSTSTYALLLSEMVLLLPSYNSEKLRKNLRNLFTSSQQQTLNPDSFISVYTVNHYIPVQ